MQVHLFSHSQLDHIANWQRLEEQIIAAMLDCKAKIVADSQLASGKGGDAFKTQLEDFSTIDGDIKRLLNKRQYLVSNALTVNNKVMELLKSSLKPENPVYGGKQLGSYKLVDKLI